MAMKYLSKLQDSLVLVLGGTSGLGFAVAEASLEYGANVIVASRSQQKIDSTIQRLITSYPEAKSRVRGYPIDLSADDVEEQIVKLLELATDNGKTKVDHIVDTSGAGGSPGDLSSATVQSLMENQKVKYVAAVLIAKYVGKYVKQATSSSYTMTSGVLAHRPLKGMAEVVVPAGTKEVLMRGLAIDLAPVRVNVVSPGAVKTEMLDGLIKNAGEQGDAVKKSFEEGTLVKALGTPEDLAESYLCSMRNRFMTGSLLHTEGGYLLNTLQ